jgi:hypothetical protein
MAHDWQAPVLLMLLGWWLPVAAIIDGVGFGQHVNLQWTHCCPCQEQTVFGSLVNWRALSDNFTGCGCLTITR